MKRTALKLTLMLTLLFLAVASTQLANLGTANFLPPPPPPLSRIYIRADGSVDPSNAPIQRIGNVCTLTASISDFVIEVQRDNIVIDGAGFSLSGKPHENGVVLAGRSNVVIKNMNVQQFNAGIYVSGCTRCTIDENTVTSSLSGIQISENSSNNIISGNVLKNNTWGISIIYSGANLFRNNAMRNNSYNLGIAADSTESISEFANDIDSSNTVDGKPVCYWVNQQNKIVPPSCGYVALIGCTNITVQNLTLAKNGQGVLLISTRNSIIRQNTITGNSYGVWADGSSSQITIVGNNIIGNINSGILFTGSNNNDITNNSITSNGKNGVHLSDSQGIKIFGNAIKANQINGINLDNTANITISENYIANHIQDTGTGIWFAQTSNSTIYRNTLENNKVGISILGFSKNNIISENTIHDNDEGIYFTTPYEASNTFRSNQLEYNKDNIRFEGNSIQDIDSSNTVNGKPVYYWVNQNNMAVPSDAGYIALINCSGITVQNVSISNSGQGIILYNTTNSLITKSKFSNNNGNGIYLVSSSNNFFSENEILGNAKEGVFACGSSNTFVQNHIANNEGNGIAFCNTHYSKIIRNNITANKAAGIALNGAQKCEILGNFIAQSELGILLYWGTSQSQVIANTITENNGWGMRIEGSEINSTIYHNNFINNKVKEGLQVSIPWPADANTWDDGKEGNYWSDYMSRYPNALEVSNTGVGDTPYFINENNIDHHPLIAPFDISSVPIPEWGSQKFQQSEPFPTTLVAVVSVASATLISLSLLVYFKKHTLKNKILQL